ncbi:MAG TPA: hypothetical protein VLE69_02585 [Candidatus Saccharimonadales bacterium]|nr:hypothetical protein [Candidatus Saccharimonadales bacterium]
MAEKLHVPSEAYDGPDPGDAGFYHDSENDPHFVGNGGRISMNEFPHAIHGIDGPHAAWVVQPGNAPDVDGKFKNWPPKAQHSEQSPGNQPISSAQARRNGHRSEAEHQRQKATGEWN